MHLRAARLTAVRAGGTASAIAAIGAVLLLVAAAVVHGAQDPLEVRDARLIDAAVAAMTAQRPGHPDLYVLGFAGDGHERVFRNEVLYLETVAARRLDADGRTLSLVNHADSLGASPRPLATAANLRRAVAGIGAAMDRDEDLLLLYLASHGSVDHALSLRLYPVIEGGLRPAEIRRALDLSGIRHRVIVVSACFSGGFLPALRDPGTLVVTASRHDRTSFGCGVASVATYFGRAWLVEGMNQGTSFVAAYDHATRTVAARERREGFNPSLPQIAIGSGIAPRLAAWQATLPTTDAVPYPHPESDTDE